ncbi:Uncharacterised protein [Mycobacteroides abscessus subsp. abscessus]|nr:Uncharacterised protein [Mycobacteroides abscessus subsp. abscessus]
MAAGRIASLFTGTSRLSRIVNPCARSACSMTCSASACDAGSLGRKKLPTPNCP